MQFPSRYPEYVVDEARLRVVVEIARQNGEILPRQAGGREPVRPAPPNLVTLERERCVRWRCAEPRRPSPLFTFCATQLSWARTLGERKAWLCSGERSTCSFSKRSPGERCTDLKSPAGSRCAPVAASISRTPRCCRHSTASRGVDCSPRTGG